MELQIGDLGNLVFLFAMAIVMFYRYTRVSSEQARANAELEAAREVQLRLVHPPSELPGFRIETVYLPAAHVGGDFYSVRPDGAGGVYVVLGDVSGKGLRAAMAVSAVIGAIRTLPGFRPGGLLRDLNHGLAGEAHEGFVTCCALHVSSDGRACIANAGHIPPWCNGAEVDCANGLPLGVVAETEYEETTLQLAAGDKLTLLTDGVVEARSATGELFGFERTTAISRGSAESIASAAEKFGLEDDLTVLTLEYVPV
jgi:serine phosphatase RsbU (regulator of sigma subunit)